MRVFGMISGMPNPFDPEKSERYFIDLKDAIGRRSSQLDDLTYHTNTALYCADRLASLPRDFWDYTGGKPSGFPAEIIGHAQQGQLIKYTASTVFLLRKFFEEQMSQNPSKHILENRADDAEQLERILRT